MGFKDFLAEIDERYLAPKRTKMLSAIFIIL